jgi:hypothetical protein
MKIDTKPRDFNYIHYKDTYPLELKGTMKRKSKPHTFHLDFSQISNKTNNVDINKLNDITVNHFQEIKCLPM